MKIERVVKCPGTDCGLFIFRFAPAPVTGLPLRRRVKGERTCVRDISCEAAEEHDLFNEPEHRTLVSLTHLFRSFV